MAAIGWTDVTDFASGLSVVKPGAQMLILAHVNSVIAVDLFGGEASTKVRMLRIMLAAHFGELALRKGGQSSTTGPVSSEKITADTVEIRYADLVGGMSEEALSRTHYGSDYLGMIKTSAAGVGFVAV